MCQRCQFIGCLSTLLSKIQIKKKIRKYFFKIIIIIKKESGKQNDKNFKNSLLFLPSHPSSRFLSLMRFPIHSLHSAFALYTLGSLALFLFCDYLRRRSRRHASISLKCLYQICVFRSNLLLSPLSSYFLFISFFFC